MLKKDVTDCVISNECSPQCNSWQCGTDSPQWKCCKHLQYDAVLAPHDGNGYHQPNLGWERQHVGYCQILSHRLHGMPLFARLALFDWKRAEKERPHQGFTFAWNHIENNHGGGSIKCQRAKRASHRRGKNKLPHQTLQRYWHLHKVIMHYKSLKWKLVLSESRIPHSIHWLITLVSLIFRHTSSASECSGFLTAFPLPLQSGCGYSVVVSVDTGKGRGEPPCLHWKCISKWGLDVNPSIQMVGYWPIPVCLPSWDIWYIEYILYTFIYVLLLYYIYI